MRGSGHCGFIGIGTWHPDDAGRVGAGYDVRGTKPPPTPGRNFEAIGYSDAGGEFLSSRITEPGSVGDGAEAHSLMLPTRTRREGLARPSRQRSCRREAAEGAAQPVPGDNHHRHVIPDSTARVLAETVASAGMNLTRRARFGGSRGAGRDPHGHGQADRRRRFERFRAVLSATAKRVVHAGDVGAGHAVRR